MIRLFLYLLVLTINLMLFQCGGDGPVVTTGGSEVWGKVVDENGYGIPDVSVKLYVNNDQILNDTSAKVLTTDKIGEYRFKDVNDGSYVIQGIQNQSGLVFLRRDIEHDSSSGRTELRDTLRIPGELLLVFNGARRGLLDGIIGFIPGTPYSGIVNNDSLLITRIAPGSYICKVAVQTVGFLLVITDAFQIESGKKMTIEVNLESDPEEAPPAPKNLILEKIIDTLSGKAIMKWDTVKVSDLKGFIIYRGIHPDSLDSNINTVTRLFDTVSLVIDTTGKSVENYFQVKSLDTLNTLSVGSNILKITAPSPQIVKTLISDTMVAPHGNLYIGDTALIIASFSNGGRLIDSIIWAFDERDSVVRKISFGSANPTNKYIDTVKFVWKDSLAKTWYITAIDNSGASVTTVKRITGSGMYPPDTWRIFPARLPKARTALSVISDGFKIYTFGGVEEKYNLSSQQFVKTTSNVIESFSPESFSSFEVSKMTAQRRYHSSILCNGKIFSFGGMTTERKNVSTIEVYDPVTGQSNIVDSLPYVRYGASLSISDNKIIMVGGIIVRGMDTIVTGAIDIYDIAKLGSGNEALRHFGELLIPRTNHSTVVRNGQVYVIGGVDTSTFNTLADVEMFDLHTGSQIFISALNENRAHFSAVMVDDKIFAFGGLSNLETYLSSVEIMDLRKNDGWKYVNQMNYPKYGMASVVHNGKVFMLGGNIVGTNGKIELDSTINVYYP